ncbi:MAG: hypothetical protein HY791_00960 [Deltaproteobacteria bacterium]|nr:hypothetical protein [Deltaproteobacteria bacterium]
MATASLGHESVGDESMEETPREEAHVIADVAFGSTGVERAASSIHAAGAPW